MRPSAVPGVLRSGHIRASCNGLLRRLSDDDFDFLLPGLDLVELAAGTTLARAGDPIDTVCFPEAGVVGFVDVLADGRRLTVGLVGREGFVGWPLVLGNNRWPHDALVRAESGSAVRVDAALLQQALAKRPAIRDLLLRFTGSLVAQMGRTIVSNLIHPVERRTARWILLYHDRVEGDEIVMTHEEFGFMLGVRRSSITDALHLLEGEGAIKGLRGRVVVRDRAHLEALAGDTYGFAEAEYARLLPEIG